MIASVTAAALNVILNLIFIPIYGYIAAAYTTLIGYVLLTLFHYYFMKRVEKRNVYDIRFIVIISLVTVVVAFVSLLLYENYIFRYFLILVISVITFKNRKVLFNVINKN
jgi:O-antigen/teichoic acid export membrane protein